jgi:hypothetical protein
MQPTTIAYPSARYLSHPSQILRSGSPLVVITTQNRDTRELRKCRNDRRWCTGRKRNLTVDALMRTSVMEVRNVDRDFVSQMAFTQDQDVIQQFTPDAGGPR